MCGWVSGNYEAKMPKMALHYIYIIKTLNQYLITTMYIQVLEYAVYLLMSLLDPQYHKIAHI